MFTARNALIIGSLLTLSSAFAQEHTVVVQPGDTLWGLAQRHNTSVEAILQTNGLTGRDLFPGAILKLPSDANARPETYKVRTGDTLYEIAVAFDMSVDELIALNDLEGTRILVDQVLVVKRNEAQAPAEPLVITVKPGDTLWLLSKRYGVSVESISQANALGRGNVLRPGDELAIPGRTAGQANADIGGSAAPTVTVAAGDSLWQIAQRYNTTVSALMAANDLKGSNLHVGQSLKIVPSNELLPAGKPQTVPTALMVWPIRGEITSRFGYRRLRISGSNYHSGLDIDGETGDTIYAATSGIVTYAGWRGGYGNLVIVQSGNVEYYYAHASALLASTGTAVVAGQPVAKVGSTGVSTGSHLHFEIRVDGEPVDPLPVLQQRASN